MLTAWCLAVALASPWLAGAPLVWLMRGRAMRAGDWLWAPFVGLAAIICPLQGLVVFADLPLSRTVPSAWVGLVPLWAAMLAAHSGRAALRRFPPRVAGLALAAFLLHGCGVLVQGVEHFRGNMQSDQYQYVALCQFLMEEPFSTDQGAVPQRPWLLQPVALKGDRIGQSVLHGFLAVSAGRGAFDLYYPTQLLAPALLVPAMLLLAAQFRLARPVAWWAAAVAATLPGTGLLQSHCYLSHALCMPALVAFLAAVVRLARGGGLRPLPYAGVAFVLALSVYGEFVPLLLGAGAAGLGAGWVSRGVPLGRLLAVALAMPLAACANPAAGDEVLVSFRRGVSAGPRMALPCGLETWAACLWVNSNAAATRVFAGIGGAAALVTGGFATGLAGAAALAVRLARRRDLLPAAAVAASLFVPPAALWIVHPDSTYVVAKLMWTLAPVFAAFLGCGLQALREGLPPRARPAAFASAWGFVTLFAYQNYLEQQNFLKRNMGRAEMARQWNAPDLRRLCSALEAGPAGVLVVALDGERHPEVASAAVCFSGRHHRVRLLAPEQVWMAPFAVPGAPGWVAPRDALVVQRRAAPRFGGAGVELLADCGEYELLRVVAEGGARAAR